ncbi:MAG: hypothetical protein JWP12_1201 [Bacteroidetes bacterium]|nr:hypothetical protein [Bacteroidota bacterium]
MSLSYANNTATEAVIYLKNGKRKYGILVDETPSTNNYQFISNDNISHFIETQSIEYIEIVPGTSIEAIETDLK